MIGTGPRADRKTMADRSARPRDRFDDVPTDLARVGAHRAPVRRRGLVVLAWAALATGLLVGAGVLGLSVIEGRVSGTAATTPATSSAAAASGPAATVDPDAQVVVLNATTTAGLAKSASTALKADDWDVTSTANADVQDVKASTVYYGQDAQLGAAKGLAKSLGITRTAKSAKYDVEGRSRLTVVLGSDWSAAG